ncbi:MAG: M48 family metallopeptidase [Burkholderiaceae bacterium]|nr:M48 family metallopeptidase [Sulfuritalea sp.]MCF8175491.1 M48 family metallopeptidase [Burkholderiaceae bacterium]
MATEQLSLFQLPEPPPAAKTRYLLIGGRIVDYRLKSGAKRLSMTIDERGLRIGAPRSVALTEIEAFVHGHGDWVLKKLGELADVTQPRHLTIKNGARLPLLDSEAEVHVLPGANRVRWVADILVLEARPEADLARLAVRALQQRALKHFAQRLDHFASQLELTVPQLRLSSAHTRWGSCSKHGGIRVNWRLIHLPTRLGDYVVAHEVAHLREMNHSPRFWSVVNSIYPDWKAARGELKQRTTSLPIL